MFAQAIISVVQPLLRYLFPMWKWLLHFITGKSEVLRIQYSDPPGAQRTLSTESCLQHSKYPELQAVIRPTDLTLDEIVQEIIRVKNINIQKYSTFLPGFTTCAEKIRGYKTLVDDLESLRKTPYRELDNREQLLQLWKDLKPDEKLEDRFTRQWGEIGFQGEDPKTDFRGMGMLGLENLCFLSSQHNHLARRLLSHSNHPKYGYSFAIVGINITELCLRFLKLGLFKSHFYNLPCNKPKVEHFHQVYCYVFYEFDKLWMTEKPNIMQFNEIRLKYEEQLILKLQDCNVHLQLASLTP